MEPSAERTHRRSSSRNSVFGSFNKKKITAVVAAVIVLVVAGVAAWMFMNNNSSAAAVDSSKYQAVFFTNGQVYFGKLQGLQNGFYKLTDIYYLQAQSTDASVQKTADSSAANPQLIKLGDEIHGPTDEMVINKDQVLFYENLKTDGKVSASIAKYQNPNKK
jgi:hypothetical protein